MKIVFMLHDGLNYSGGPAINANRLLPALQQRGHEVTALALYLDEPSNAAYLQSKGVKVITLQYPIYSEDLVEWIVRTVKELNPDVFVPNIIPQGGLAASWIKAAGIPTIMTHRSEDFYNWTNAKVFACGDAKWACSGLVCVSDYLKNQVIATGKLRSSITVIPSGVPVSPYITDQAAPGLRIVYAGRLVERQKRINEVLKSFVALAQRLPASQFTIIGEGQEHANAVRLVDEAGLSAKFRFTGRLVGDQYHQELARNHAIVLMSDYEGMPGALMDGMSCGLIPITLRTNGIEALVKHEKTGFIIENRTSDFFKYAEMLYQQVDLRKTMSTQAREHVISSFSLDSALLCWESFFNQLTASAGEKRSIEVPHKIRLPYRTYAIEHSKRKHKSFNYYVNEGKKKANRLVKKGIFALLKR